jgi:1-acyl-sn-glycerol-3-phosphate acyltransferase
MPKDTARSLIEQIGEQIGDQIDRLVPAALAERVDRATHGINSYGYDKWGFSPTAAKRSLLITELLYRRYFRVQVHGIERVPPGRGLLIGNHSAQLAYDGMMIETAMLLDAEPPRAVRAMIEKFFQLLPLVNVLLARNGQLTGLPENCERLLREDELILVFPEGARGGGKVWKDRYKLFDFGTGFMRLALKTGSPITPFAFIGGEEACAALIDIKPLARLFGFPYFPLTPTLLPLPLPARCSIYFDEPLRFEGTGDEEDAEIIAKVNVVKARVAALIQRGLAERKGVFF